ncbi:MAG: hypothetical protein ACLTL8_00720 [Bifidobacterium pseudocatenulatum]
MGLAMIVLDSSIVNVSIPTIIDDIGIDLTDASGSHHCTTSYSAALLLPFGKLGDARTQTGIPNWNCDFRGKFIARRHIAGRWHAAHRSRVAGIGGAMIMPNTPSTVPPRSVAVALRLSESGAR